MCVQCIMGDPSTIFSVTGEHSDPPPFSKPSRARAFVERGAARSFSVCLSAPRFLLDGVGTLTNSIWNVGRTPVNAGSGSQQNHLWSVVFFPSSLSLSVPLLTLTDHKKTYGEEHGSCQAGIAGVFTEVSRSTSMLCVFTCVALWAGESVL